MRVLVVDDDPVCLDYLVNVLPGLGYEVEAAQNGREAFELIRSGDIRVVLSDWQMPEMTGIELCERIRQRQLSAYVYFVLLTSLEGRENMVTGLRGRGR